MSIKDCKLQWFSDEVKERMRDKEVTIGEMSYHCKIRSALLGNYIQGKTFPNLWALILIADFLETTTNELLDFDEAQEDSLLMYDPFSIFDDEDEFAMHIRNRLENFMVNEHISIAELSEKSGFTRQTIRKWLGMNEKQPELPRTSDFLRVCDALDCTPSDLLGY